MKVPIPAICILFALQAAWGDTTKTPGVLRIALCQTPTMETFGWFDETNGVPSGVAGAPLPGTNAEERIDTLFDWVCDRLAGDEDVVVLPECAFGSFSGLGEAWRFAESVWSKSAEFALGNEVWLVVNHPYREDGEESPMFNETRIFSPDGDVFRTYRKRVLANMDGAASFSPGKETVVADLPFGRVGLLICKDAQYPGKGGSGYAAADLLLVQFAHPGVDDPDAPEAEFFPSSADGLQLVRDVRRKWDFLSVPFLAVNKTGPDGNYVLSGGTYAADGDGEIVVCADREPTVVEVELPLLEDGRVASPPPFFVALDAAGGTAPRAGIEVVRGDPVGALPVPTRKGYGFLGWYTAPSGGSKATPSMRPSRNTTLYARWSATTYRIAFSANGGTLPKGRTMAAQKMTYGKAAALRKNAFVRTGYVFAGWSAKKGGAIAYRNAQTVKNLRADGRATTLYAVWAKPRYKVAFYANGGTGTMAVQTFKYGTAANLSANRFSRKGYAFAGWATSAANSRAGRVKYGNKQAVKNLTLAGGTVKLYAVWKRK